MITNIVKMAFDLTASTGIGIMGAELTMRLIPEGASTITKVCCTVAGSAGSGLVGWKVCEYGEEVIGDCSEAIKKVLKKDKKEKATE